MLASITLVQNVHSHNVAFPVDIIVGKMLYMMRKYMSLNNILNNFINCAVNGINKCRITLFPHLPALSVKLLMRHKN